MRKEELNVVKRLGKGKSGVSYLAESPLGLVVLKQMHDEEVPYYTFEKPKICHEKDSYAVLSGLDIRIPRLIFLNEEESYLVKEYIPGLTVSESLAEGLITDEHLIQMLGWEKKLARESLNIDYFPSNFVIWEKQLYYIDYEHNPYTDEWNFRNWGIYYWLNPHGMEQFLKTGDNSAINLPDTGKPLKTLQMEERRHRLLQTLEG